MMVKIDFKVLLAEVVRLATQYPNAIYTSFSCKYGSGRCTNGQVGCILGQAARNVCPELYNEMVKEEATYAVSFDDLTSVKASFSENSAHIAALQDIQNLQDSGSSFGEGAAWGKIVATVRAKYPDLEWPC